jgi:hypothetical protein
MYVALLRLLADHIDESLGRIAACASVSRATKLCGDDSEDLIEGTEPDPSSKGISSSDCVLASCGQRQFIRNHGQNLALGGSSISKN